MNIKYENVKKGLSGLAQTVATGAIPCAPENWGGADVVVTDHPPKAQAELEFYSSPRTVITPHSRQLSWLMYQLRDLFTGQLDSATKIEFYGRL